MPPTAPRINSSLRIPALDGLRGIAILLVLLWHSLFRTTFLHYPALTRALGVGRFSWSGVDLFFVLSGFLIGGILLDHRDSPRYFQTFYLRRAYRILPLYFVVLTLCWITQLLVRHGWTPFDHVDVFPGTVPWWSFFTFTQNLAVAITGGTSRGGLGVTWSLAIEEQFYLTLPFLLRRIAPRNLIYLLAAIIGGVPILRAFVIQHWSRGAEVAYVLTPTRGDALALGVLCAVLVRNETAWRYLLAYRAWIYATLASLGLCIAFMTWREFPFFNRAFYGMEFSILAFLYTALLLVAVTGNYQGNGQKDGKFVRAVLCNPQLMKLGTVAYGTYLLHFIMIDLARFLLTYDRPNSPAIAFIGADVLGIAGAVALATASWRYFEKPLVRRGHAYDY